MCKHKNYIFYVLTIFLSLIRNYNVVSSKKRMRFLLVILAFFNSVSLFSQTSIKPFILGQVHEIESKILNQKRSLNIYLPPSYTVADSKKFPVVYLLDGSANEDFIHVVGMYQFNSFPWVNTTKESIIVGIENVDRKHDFTFPSSSEKDKKMTPTSGGSEAFRNFISSELQPYIEKNFKTSNEKTLIGQSLGGLFACETLIKQPTLFNNYLIISPSLWWSNGELIPLFKSVETKSLLHSTIYFAVGKEGVMPSTEPHIMEVDVNLVYDELAQRNELKNKIYLDFLPAENHASIGHIALMNGLNWFNKIQTQ